MTSCRKPAGVYGYGKEGHEQPTLAVHRWGVVRGQAGGQRNTPTSEVQAFLCFGIISP